MEQQTLIVKLIGGLGNQMFQYAYARKLALSSNLQLKLDKTLLDFSIWQKFIGITARKYELNEFKINENFAGFWEAILKIKEGLYVKGFWQNEKYFKEIRNVLLKDFTLKNKSSRFLNIQKMIRRTNSVAIHFRRGDYVNDPITNKFHGVLNLDYYYKAVEIIKTKIKNPQFYIFSDDIVWVKENFKTKYPTNYVNHFRVSAEELILMSLCKHQIIANSSFSWWGAWLNKNDKKIVVAPKKWFNNKDDQGVIPREWIRV